MQHGHEVFIPTGANGEVLERSQPEDDIAISEVSGPLVGRKRAGGGHTQFASSDGLSRDKLWLLPRDLRISPRDRGYGIDT
jgi:hypothetical protein